MNNLLIYPRPTEKAYTLSQKNVYVFNVPLDANKSQIAQNVAAQYSVKVTNVATVVQTGKSIRFSRGKRKFPGTTTRRNTKKAYVTLAKGDSIQIFAETDSKQEATK